MANAFEPKPGCNVPNVERIEPIIIDETLCTPENAIHEFPIFDFPPPLPPGHDFGCTPLRTTINLVNGDDPAFNITAVEDTERGPCDPNVTYDISIPNCVNVSTSGAIRAGATPKILFAAAKGTNPCRQDFNLDLEVPPCVTLNTNATMVQGTDNVGSITFGKTKKPPQPFNDDSQCEWDLNLDIVLPKITASAGSVDGLCQARLATTVEVPLTGLAAIDGFTPLTNDKVLVKNQTDKKLNGVYKANATGWQRDADCPMVSGGVVSVAKGTKNGGSAWVLTTDGLISVGSDDIEYAQIGSGCCCTARAATFNNVTLSGLQTIDSVALAADETVLVRAQTNAAQNGVYIVKSGAWERTCTIFAGMMVSVREGKALGNTVWMLRTNDPITIDTTLLRFQWIHNNHVSAHVSSDVLGTGLGNRDVTAVTAGDRVLVFNAGVNNGLYVAQAGTWARILDFNTTTDPSIIGLMITVANGQRRQASFFVVISSNTVLGGSPFLAEGSGL